MKLAERTPELHSQVNTGLPAVDQRITPSEAKGQQCDRNAASARTTTNARLPARLRGWLVQWGLRAALTIYCLLLGLAKRAVPRRRLAQDMPRSILLTGTFFSENWIMNHLRPLSRSAATGKVWVVCTSTIPPTSKVIHIMPPAWLHRICGATCARLLACGWLALVHRPDVIGGFHLLPNGLVAALLARVTGGRSLYLCGGGPAEIDRGGFISENRLFTYLPGPDLFLERRLIQGVQYCDLVITMGSRAIDYFTAKGVKSQFAVIPGGIDSTRFSDDSSEPGRMYDLLLVGRLVRVKRIDLFLEVVSELKRNHPEISAAVVGDGGLEAELKSIAAELGVSKEVHFAGYHKRVAPWLKQSKIFVLTSDSEGLSLAVMEAMACGLPCVVSDVGEMRELVKHGKNGFLVKERTAAAFAEYIHKILVDETLCAALAAEARRTAHGFDVRTAKMSWDRVLSSLS